MIHLIALLGFFGSFLTGATLRGRAGWPIIWLVPLLGTITFTIVPSDLFPLTFYRVALAVTIGIVVTDRRRGTQLRRLFRAPMVQIAAAFYLFVIVLSLSDAVRTTIFSLMPRLLVAFLLCFFVVRTERDLLRFTKVIMWSASIIAISAIAEFGWGFSIATVLASTIPNFEITQLQTVGLNEIERSGFYRAAGITGNQISTGYTLAFYFPLTLWCALRGRLLGSLPLVLVIGGLFVVQTRAAFVAVAISLAWLGFQHLSLRTLITTARRIALKAAPALVLAALLLLTVPDLRNLASSFLRETLVPSLSGVNELNETKLMRLPYAYERFLERPILGHGSPRFAYSEVMRNEDVPGPVIYALAGGLPLAILHLLVLFYLPYSTRRLTKNKSLGLNWKEFLNYASAAFLAGVVVVFSNPKDDHFYLMFMLYVAIYSALGPDARKPARGSHRRRKMLAPQHPRVSAAEIPELAGHESLNPSRSRI